MALRQLAAFYRQLTADQMVFTGRVWRYELSISKSVRRLLLEN